MRLAKLKETCHAFIKDEDGATAIEYALLAGILTIGLISSLGRMGSLIGEDLTELGDTIERQDLNTGHVD